eukprot:1706203-Prymnesium_polylepis.1
MPVRWRRRAALGAILRWRLALLPAARLVSQWAFTSTAASAFKKWREESRVHRGRSEYGRRVLEPRTSGGGSLTC